MGASIGIGVALGIYLDKRFGSEPWLTIIFFGFGLVAAFRAFFRLVKKFAPSKSKSEGKEPE